MKSLRLKYTANFKRDYVAGAALVIFFLIVCGEIFLAVSLPIYMNRDAALAVSVRRLRLVETFDQVRYRFCLGEIHLPIQESTFRELAGLSHPGSAGDQQSQNSRYDIVGCVTGYFDGIFARVGVRGPKQGNQHFIDQHTLTIPDRPEMKRIACCIS